MKIMQKLGYVSILGSIGLLILFGVTLLYPFNPIDLYDEHGVELPYDKETKTYAGLKVLDEEIKLEDGKIYFYEVNYCRHTEVSVIVEKHLVNMEKELEELNKDNEKLKEPIEMTKKIMGGIIPLAEI